MTSCHSSSGGSIPRHASGLDSKICAEVTHAVSGMTRAEVDEIVKQLMPDLEQQLRFLVQQALEDRLPGWRERTAGAPGAVLFHQDANYLFYRLDVPILGYLEPVPGIPPTAAHIKSLTDELQGRQGVIVHTPFQPDRAPKALAGALGWQVRRLSLEPPLDATAEDYIALIDSWVTAMSGAE